MDRDSTLSPGTIVGRRTARRRVGLWSEIDRAVALDAAGARRNRASGVRRRFHADGVRARTAAGRIPAPLIVALAALMGSASACAHLPMQASQPIRVLGLNMQI